MSKTTRMLTAAPDGTTNSEVVHCQRSKDETGIVQAKRSADTVGWGTGLLVQGRASSLCGWFTLTSFVDADFDTDPNGGLTYAEVVQLFPQMRIVSAAQNGGGTVDAWLIE